MSISSQLLYLAGKTEELERQNDACRRIVQQTEFELNNVITTQREFFANQIEELKDQLQVVTFQRNKYAEIITQLGAGAALFNQEAPVAKKFRRE
jgi:prolyl oligopeptidase PreP (S9A serine peptidase family)